MRTTTALAGVEDTGGDGIALRGPQRPYGVTRPGRGVADSALKRSARGALLGGNDSPGRASHVPARPGDGEVQGVRVIGVAVAVELYTSPLHRGECVGEFGVVAAAVVRPHTAHRRGELGMLG